MNESGKFTATFEQVGPFNFNIVLTNPDGIKFFAHSQCHPGQMNEEAIINNFRQCYESRRFNDIWSIEANIIANTGESNLVKEKEILVSGDVKIN